MIDKLLVILLKVDFVNRYRNLCEQHSDFDNSMGTTKIKQLLDIYKQLDSSVKYESFDRLYTLGFSFEEYHIEFSSKLHRGLAQPYFFIEKVDEKLYFHRFDFICRELDPSFGDKHNVPVYGSEEELTEILKELLLIYEDVKQEFLIGI